MMHDPEPMKAEQETTDAAQPLTNAECYALINIIHTVDKRGDLPHNPLLHNWETIVSKLHHQVRNPNHPIP